MCDINDTGEITQYNFRFPTSTMTSKQSVCSVIISNQNQSTQQQPAQPVTPPPFQPIGARLTLPSNSSQYDPPKQLESQPKETSLKHPRKWSCRKNQKLSKHRLPAN